LFAARICNNTLELLLVYEGQAVRNSSEFSSHGEESSSELSGTLGF
jgi:hypothetical protein